MTRIRLDHISHPHNHHQIVAKQKCQNSMDVSVLFCRWVRSVQLLLVVAEDDEGSGGAAPYDGCRAHD